MVDKRSVFSQLQQRHHVPRAGPHFAFSPTSYGVTIGTDATGDLRPRKAGLLLEPLQALWEVAGENVGPSAVVCALSRHRAGPSKVCVSALSLRERPGRAGPTPALDIHVCGLFALAGALDDDAPRRGSRRSIVATTKVLPPLYRASWTSCPPRRNSPPPPGSGNPRLPPRCHRCRSWPCRPRRWWRTSSSVVR